MSFEDQLSNILSKEIPQRYLSNVPVFRPDKVIDIEGKASEIDFLLHVQSGDTHKIIIVEAKGCPIVGPDGHSLNSKSDKSDWQCVYNNGASSQAGNSSAAKRKSVKYQVRMQAYALKLNLEPLVEGNRVKFYCLVVSNKAEIKGIRLTDNPSPDLQVSLLHLSDFQVMLRAFIDSGDILRVQESDILRRLRFGQPVPELGHPEIPHAIDYARRCRGFLDSELFQHFQPRGRHWAINGSAGMGKSVLLAYSLMVLTTNRFIDKLKDHTRYLNDYESQADKLGLPAINQRRIWALALSEKQRQSLELAYSGFERLYKEIDPFNHYRRISPSIQLWSGVESLNDCNVLLIDESHDLNEAAQKRIHDWYTADKRRFLFIACDRHQKLRLISKNARILNGFDFSLQTTKLDRNYRNPFPVHCASMALLFRWFTDSGPKVIPTKEELEQGLGFSVNGDTRSDTITLESRNDAHPANNWSHLVSMYTGPRELEAQLHETSLKKEEVLWTRFNVEVPEFSYEKLSRYTYHNLYSNDTSEVIDKYIKGQEFPIVVIEGLPEDFEAGINGDEAAERRMWIARRQLYLVASRATCFLFFVRSGNESEETLAEVRNMTSQLSSPDIEAKLSGPSGKLWKVNFSRTERPHTVPDYLNIISSKNDNTEPQASVIPDTNGSSYTKDEEASSEVKLVAQHFESHVKTEDAPASKVELPHHESLSNSPKIETRKDKQETEPSPRWISWVDNPDLSDLLIDLLDHGLERLPTNRAELYTSERYLRKESASRNAVENCDRKFLRNLESTLKPILRKQEGTPLDLIIKIKEIKRKAASPKPTLSRMKETCLERRESNVAKQSKPTESVIPSTNPTTRPVCILSRPVTPASISKTLNASREHLAKLMEQRNIKALQNTPLSDTNIGNLIRDLGYRAIITGNIKR